MILAAVLGIEPIETKTAVERAVRRLLQKKARQQAMMAQGGMVMGG